MPWICFTQNYDWQPPDARWMIAYKTGQIYLVKQAVAEKAIGAGKAKLVIADKSSIHNFHLTGPGVNVKTSVSATGTKTFTVTLKKGTYRFVCDPHASSMKGSFKVS